MKNNDFYGWNLPAPDEDLPSREKGTPSYTNSPGKEPFPVSDTTAMRDTEPAGTPPVKPLYAEPVQDEGEGPKPSYAAQEPLKAAEAGAAPGGREDNPPARVHVVPMQSTPGTQPPAAVHSGEDNTLQMPRPGSIGPRVHIASRMHGTEGQPEPGTIQTGYINRSPMYGSPAPGPVIPPQDHYRSAPYYTGPGQGGGNTLPPLGAHTPKPEEQPPKQKKNGGKWAVRVAGLVLAGACGFGGGYLANINGDNSSTIVYRSPDTGTNTSANAGTGDALSLIEVAAVAGQSVVSITTENLVTNPLSQGQVVSGAGSGVIISEDGYIITNNHVVSGADNVIVTLPDGTDLEAEIVGADEASDVAVIKVDATDLIPAVIGNSDTLQVGETAVAIGNPMGTLSGTVTDGIISALDREVNIDNNNMTLLQTSAAVSPGNSGGGLFNDRAELIGVVNAKSNGESAEGLGFAIPVNDAMQVAEDLINHGYVSGRPALGVYVLNVTTAEQALQAGVNALGVYLSEVNPGGAAEQAGLQAGDRVLSFNGVEIDTTSGLTSAIRGCEVGDTVEMTVMRGNETITVDVTLQEMTG